MKLLILLNTITVIIVQIYLYDVDSLQILDLHQAQNVHVYVQCKNTQSLIQCSLVTASDAENSRSACFDWQNFIRTGINFIINFEIYR